MNVYFHINPLKNEIFYVGIGNDKRPFHKRQRSDLWNNIISKYGYIVDIVHKEVSRGEAIELEKFYINKIGRRNLGLGTLVNLTDGGDGITKGFKHRNGFTKEHKEKIGLAQKGEKNHMFGKKLKECHKIKLLEGARKKGRKKKPPISEETREKLRIKSTGRKLTQEQIEVIKKRLIGSKLSEETKRKISETHKLNHKNKANGK
jgi:hypothetical protein